MSIEQQLLQLISTADSGWSCRRWISAGPLHVYIRVTQRFIGGGIVPTIDVASIEVEESQRGRGRSSALFELVERVADRATRIVYVECVLNRRFADWLQRRGYTRLPGEGSPSFYRRASGGSG